MPSSYPNSIQNFPTMQDMTASDALLVTQFQQAMQAGNIPLAQTILVQITDKDKKIISAELLNTAWDTLVALQKQFTTKYSPAYIISETQPADQEIGDYWFEVVKTGSMNRLMNYQDIHASDIDSWKSFREKYQSDDFEGAQAIAQTLTNMQINAQALNDLFNFIVETEQLSDSTFKSDVIQVSTTAPSNLQVGQMYFKEYT